MFNYVSINRSETENTTHVVLAFIGVQSTANGKEDISGSVVLAQNKEVTLRVYVGIQNEEGSPPVLSDKPQGITTTDIMLPSDCSKASKQPADMKP